MQENKLSEQLDDYENLISEFKSKMATLRQHEDELNQKKTILEAKEQELNFREIESNQNCNEENEQMLDRIKIKLDKINQKEKELELKLNSEPSLKHESNHKITEIEHSKKLLEGQILQFKAQNEAYILEIESLRAANNSLNEELKSKSQKRNEDLDDQFDLLREKEDKIKEMMEVVNNTIATKQKALEEWEMDLDTKQQQFEQMQNDNTDPQMNLKTNETVRKTRELEKYVEIKNNEITKIQEKFKILDDKYKILKIQLNKVDGFINQFDSNQLSNLQKSELNLINKLIQSVNQNEYNISEDDASKLSYNYDSELKKTLINYENQLVVKENELKSKESSLNTNIQEIKQALSIGKDQTISSVHSNVIKYKNTEKIFNDYEGLIDKQESEINSLKTKIKLISEGSNNNNNNNEQYKANKSKQQAEILELKEKIEFFEKQLDQKQKALKQFLEQNMEQFNTLKSMEES